MKNSNSTPLIKNIVDRFSKNPGEEEEEENEQH